MGKKSKQQQMQSPRTSTPDAASANASDSTSLLPPAAAVVLSPARGYGAIPLAADDDASVKPTNALHERDTVRRSQVAHALLHKQDDLEAQTIPASASVRVELAIHASLAINVVLAIAKVYAAATSGSLAVLSSLVDSILDLASQALFWYSDKRMHTPSVKYPAGRRRLEPIAVIISATLMGMAGAALAFVCVQLATDS